MTSFHYSKPRWRWFSISVLCGHTVGIFALSAFLTKLTLLTGKRRKGREKESFQSSFLHKENSWSVHIQRLWHSFCGMIFKAEAWAQWDTSVISSFTRLRLRTVCLRPALSLQQCDAVSKGGKTLKAKRTSLSGWLKLAWPVGKLAISLMLTYMGVFDNNHCFIVWTWSFGLWRLLVF